MTAAGNGGSGSGSEEEHDNQTDDVKIVDKMIVAMGFIAVIQINLSYKTQVF